MELVETSVLDKGNKILFCLQLCITVHIPQILVALNRILG